MTKLEEPPAAHPVVLLVDDNRSYREAFRRNLLLEGYEVQEAGDSDEAMARVREASPGVIVTDLSMRRPNEGLDLIRQARTHDPHLPIIMISAVGTFEEGAEASRLGARYVISKSKIDEELGRLFTAIDQAHREYLKAKAASARIAELRQSFETEPSEAQAALRRLIAARDTPETVKGEAYDLLSEWGAPEMAATSRQDLDRARDAGGVPADLFGEAEANLNAALKNFPSMDQQTQESMRTAEYLYLHSERVEANVDFSRSIGFSYCFAAENEIKGRLRKTFQKFFADHATQPLVRSLLEDNRRGLSVFFHQYLLRLLRDIAMDVTIDNVYQTFVRMLEHGGKYKPDGLKALGIVMVCFGRTYKFKKFDKEVVIDNPLGVRGLDGDKQALQFGVLLTNLQHYRNPYIHPEISEMEKLSKIRQTAIECLDLAMRLG